MKKAIIMLLVVGSLTAFFEGCSANQEFIAVTEAPTLAQMSTEKNTYQPTDEKILLTIKNTGQSEISFGADYGIQKYDDYRWVNVPLKKNSAFESISYSSKPNDNHTETVYFNMFQYTFDRGRYRIIKKLTIGKDSWYESCDFDIE